MTQTLDEKIDEVVKRLDRIEHFLIATAVPKTKILLKDPDVVNLPQDTVHLLLSLPSHLQKTAKILATGKAFDAVEVSKKTKRARAVESMYLNQLVTMGILKKFQDGRSVIFQWDWKPNDE